MKRLLVLIVRGGCLLFDSKIENQADGQLLWHFLDVPKRVFKVIIIAVVFSFMFRSFVKF